MKEIILKNGRKIGEGHPVYIIMDVAANHNGDLDTAKKLVKEAAKAGADAIKLQTYEADKLYSKKTPKFARDPINPYDLIKSVEHPREWLPILKGYAQQYRIDFLSSPFDYEAVDLLDSIEVPFYKVASSEIVDLELISYMASKGKPMIISTGMANLGEIEEAVEAVKKTGNSDIILLHCNTSYPTPAHIVNLNAIDTMKNAFRVPIGFSDHTLEWHIPLAAVVKGACVIEKHFTLDKNQEGPDHSFAIEPKELKKMIDHIRDIEAAMGDGIKKVVPEEMESYTKGRRSIIANTDISKGSKITKDMLIVKRPGYGIKPKFIDMLISRTTKTDIAKDDIITWDMLV